jgi:RHS repeat-associated protein
MLKGLQTVGHPVDVASGTVYSTHRDIDITGKVSLTWERYYTTALLDLPNTPLGPGWTTRYFCTLTDAGAEYRFVTPGGYVEIFADPGRTIERGGCVRNLGTFQELVKRDSRYIVTRWDVETGEIERYVFKEGRKGESWLLESIEDVTGQGIDLARDQRSRLTEIRQRLEKRTLVLGYSAHNQITSVSFRHSDGQIRKLVQYEYDRDGRLSAATDALGHTDRYEYDSAGRMTREIVKDGGVFYFKYDHKGRCFKTSGLDRYDEKSLRYFDYGLTEVTNSLGYITHYQWMPSGQVTTEIDPQGGTRKTEYDGQGRIVAESDSGGATTRYAYDASGNRAAVTDALGHTIGFAYNEHHLPTTMTDPVGRVWRREYNKANLLIASVDPAGNRWTIRYDADGNVSEIQNPLGAVKRQLYNRGLLESVTDWKGNTTRYVLDIFGRVIEFTGPVGEVFRISYDALGRPVKVTLPDGSTQRSTYDSVGNITSFTDGDNRTTHFRYGPCKRLLERENPSGAVVRYAWGSEPGWLEQVINEKGETYKLVRNKVGRVIRSQGFDGAARHFEVDANGYVSAYTNANGERISIQRDAMRRVIGLTLPDGEHVTYSFNPTGSMIAAVNSDLALTFERDPLGQIRRELQGAHWVESHYNTLGNLTRVTTSLGHTVDYEIDPNGFVNKLTTLNNQVIEFARNGYGQETNRRMPGGIAMEQRYDGLGRLLEQSVRSGPTGFSNAVGVPRQNEIIRRNYAYGRDGSLTSIVDSNRGRIDYLLDPADRLLSAVRDRGLSESFSYDPAGNITRMRIQDKESTDVALAYGPGNRLLQKGSTRYEYDSEGRRVKKIENADSDNPKIWLYEWNALDQLKTVTRPGGEVWRYKYDALGRRVGKIGPNYSRQFLWHEGVVIQEVAGAQSLAAWMFDTYSYAPIATVQNASLFSVINDHLGTPREIVDSRGSVAWSMEFKSWGQTLKQTPGPLAMTPIASVEQNLRFQGQYFDAETGLHYNRNRYYDPEIGAYASDDPIGLMGGLNQYSYTHNPVNWIDPLGLIDPWDVYFSREPHGPEEVFQHGPWADRTVGEAIDETRRLGRLPEGLQVHGDWLVLPSGEQIAVAANNRTLYVAQEANLRDIAIHDLGTNAGAHAVQRQFALARDKGGTGYPIEPGDIAIRQTDCE